MVEREPGRDADSGRSSDRECTCKLGRSCRARGLASLPAAVERRHDDGASLRDLERFVNESILERALADGNADVLGDVGSVYETLAGDAATAGERTELRQRLESAGVDVDAVQSDWISYQTVRTHLRECCSVDTDREVPLTRSDAAGTIEWARSRSEGIVERTLERLASRDALAAGDLEVTHVVRVRCADCGAAATVDAFLDDGGCDCSNETPSE